MNASVLSMIRTNYDILSNSQRRVADFVLKNPDRVMISSMLDLATACGVSEPTVMRFLRKLKYDSYQVFRVNIAQELGVGSNKNLYYEDIHESDSSQTIINKVLNVTAQSLMDCIQLINAQALDNVVERLIKSQRVLVIGMGSSYSPAFDLSHKLQRLGIYATSCHDSHMINIMSTNLASKDMMIAYSHSGESHEILDGVRFAKKNNAYAAAVTSYRSSSLVSLCDDVLLSCSRETSYRSDAMTSRIIQMTVTDMIYLCLALKMGDSAQENINLTRVAVAKNKT